jgi:hypothetical protein
MDPNANNPLPVRSDFTQPIARSGEQQFGAIVRNRSGIDAGSVDFSARMIGELCEGDQQDCVEMAYCLYESFCNQTGKRSVNEGRRP